VATINKSEYQLAISELLNLCVKLEFYEIASEIHKPLTSKRGRKPLKKEVTQSVMI
jgi:hypothetical protein